MTVSNIFSRKSSRIALLFTLFVSLYSCGTYQSAYNDDGIYGSNNQKADEEIVIVEKSEFDKNYFSNQLDEIQNIDEEDVFTDIDDYYYEDTYETDELWASFRSHNSKVHMLRNGAGHLWISLAMFGRRGISRGSSLGDCERYGHLRAPPLIK